MTCDILHGIRIDMLETEEKNVENLKALRERFRSRLSELKKAKGNLFKLFRQRLEEKKVKEIKDSINIRS